MTSCVTLCYGDYDSSIHGPNTAAYPFLIDCSYCEEEKYLVQTKKLFYVLLSFSSGNLYNTPPPPTDNTSLSLAVDC